jgi:hypothetical protein
VYLSADFCRNLKFADFYRRCTFLQISVEILNLQISAEGGPFCREVHTFCNFCRNLRFLQRVYLSAEICREVHTFCRFMQFLQRGAHFLQISAEILDFCRGCTFLQKSAERCTLSADFCRNCRKLRFLQKVCTSLQKLQRSKTSADCRWYSLKAKLLSLKAYKAKDLKAKLSLKAKA